MGKTVVQDEVGEDEIHVSVPPPTFLSSVSSSVKWSY